MACVKSELCLFNTIIPQNVIDNYNFTTHYPVEIPATHRGVIKFDFNVGEDYLDLSQTLLYVKLGTIKKEADKDIAFKDNVFSMLFSDYDLSLNSQRIETGDGHYIHKSIFDYNLSFNNETKRVRAMTYGASDDENIRAKWIDRSLELCAPLQIDFFNQEKFLLPHTDILLQLKSSEAGFIYHKWGATNNAEPTYIIKEIKLLTRSVKVCESVKLGHELGLQTKNATYNYNLNRLVTFSVAAGSSSFYKDNLFGDRRMPKLVVITVAYNSQITANYSQYKSLNYTCADVSEVILSKSGHRDVYSVNFHNKSDSNLMETYVKSIIRNMGGISCNNNIGITFDQWKNAYTFYIFNIASDFDAQAPQFPKDGNLQLEIKFDGTMTGAGTIIVYGVFDHELQITSNRRVIQ